MSGDLSLFGDDQPHEPAPPVRTEVPIADWLVDALREALTARGLTTTGERQRAVESVAGRPVESLRALTRAEALHILSSLGPASAPETRSASAWDNREENTWIDRL
ncbi:hypothetical protein [Geodermatophilus obscurus]|uniref:hypothetical protein n=1 Tax=Geodermatophilus obscurus TaxID=1861 RepID=UPI001140C7EE|nr:hypothetical protein [Geodermatophilus obscurus]